MYVRFITVHTHTHTHREMSKHSVNPKFSPRPPGTPLQLNGRTQAMGSQGRLTGRKVLGGSFGGLGSGWVTWGGSKDAGIHSSLGAVRKWCPSESPLQGGGSWGEEEAGISKEVAVPHFS